MTHPLLIRPGLASDEQAFVRMNLEFMSETMASNPYWKTLGLPSPEEMGRVYREALEVPESIRIFVAELDGEVAGYANTWTTYSIWSRGKILMVDDLYVSLPYRKRHVGEGIMTFLAAYAQERDYRRIQLLAEGDNHRAHALYRKLAFQEEDMLFFMRKL